MSQPHPKVALITGGSDGIGAATALLAAQQGYDVAFTYLNQASAAEIIAERITRLGRKDSPAARRGARGSRQKYPLVSLG